MIKMPLISSSWLSFLIFSWLYSCLNRHLVSTQCLDDQKSLLLKLEADLSFRLGLWNQSTDCCQWSGVECDNSTDRVIGLDLSTKFIISGISNSSSLFRLKFLQRLNLANNFIEGEIPSALGKLSSLTYLNLSHTSFSGQVPIEISQLVKLVVLDISNSGGFAKTLYMKKPNLATIIQNLTNIRELYLDSVNNSATGNEWGKVLSSSLPHLQVLSMPSCDLRGEIHHSLSKLRQLSMIILHSNSLAGPVPAFLAGFTNLTTLLLANSGLKGTVSGKIFQVPTLRALDLSRNHKLQGTLPAFYKNGSLEELSLAQTNFFGILPSSITNLKSLRGIDLSYCYFHGSIPSSMGSLSQLEDVDFSGNQFSGLIPSFSPAKSLKSLKLVGNNLNGSITATNWGKLCDLEVLNLSNNSLDGSITTIDWGKLHGLEVLDLSYNFLKGSIPTSLFSLPSLESIDFGQNKFSGLNEFASIASSKLSTLTLNNNNLIGPIPQSIFRLRMLHSLDLSSNKFNGTLKLAELQSLKNLVYLHLSDNNLSINTDGFGKNSSFPHLSFLYLSSCNLSSVPEFLKDQTSLQDLDLSKNRISGTVPEWLWQFGSLNILNLSHNHLVNMEPPRSNKSNLFSLDLHANNLQGQFPSVSTNLVLLDCSNNNFSSIDPDVGNYLSEAMLLSFSKNNLYGGIPTILCNATKLMLLNLEYNYLNGTIPDCLIAKSTTLKVLNLRGNNVRGGIPAIFGKGCRLETLNLNGNFLQGLIPRSLANCIALKVLDLGNNHLVDTFPCHLQSLSNLQVLVLRSNSFDGTMVCPWSHSMWPLLQIVDLASNHFSGELTAQTLLKWTSMKLGTSKVQSKPDRLQTDVGGVYYQDSVALNFKGNTYDLQYILTIFTSIDLTNNAFHGKLPKELGSLNALKVLNLSQNSFSGYIPTSIGNLSQIESLDLSCNEFCGNIPPQFANLNFLEYLNLSFNKLSGVIPTSTQLQSFDASSYKGNRGLSGPPLTPISRSEPNPRTPPSTSSYESSWSSKSQIEWMLKGAEVGFPVGITIFIGPLLYIKRYREWYCKQLHKLVMKILCKEDSARGRKRRSSRQRRQRRR